MAANFCLVPLAVDKFKQAVVSGKIDPYKLNKMTSEQRRSIFSEVVGEDAAKHVNALFEGRMLLKNQKFAYTSWAKKVAGITPEVRRDLLSRIQRLDHVLDPAEQKMFLQDLAEARLGFGVTDVEAKTISNLSKAVTETESKAKPDHTFGSDLDRLAYGKAKVNIENYVNDLKLQSRKLRLGKQPFEASKRAVVATPGVLKSLVSSLDDSFFGRQGIKVLLNPRTSDIWVKDFVKSLPDMVRTIKGGEAMDIIKSDIYSRPNALNGKYKAGNYGLHVLSEEAYPSALPEKIPLLGRLFKASEVAYNGGALRMRADLADRYIKIAEKQGINTLDKKQAEGLGTLIGGMTGRGSLDGTNSFTNSLLFSVKFLKANFDTLTLHTFDSKATRFTKVEAAKNMLGIVTSLASILTVAHTLNPKSVETDPRSPNFGKVKVGGHWVDITGGMSSLAVLAARLVPTEHNGKLGLWSKDKSGAFTNLASGAFGAQTGVGLLESFWEGKLAPAPGILRDIYNGRNYSNQKPTPKNEAVGATTPLIIQTFQQLKDAKNSDKVALLILDGLGFSVNSSGSVAQSSWKSSNSADIQAFKTKVGGSKFDQASDEYDRRSAAAVDKLTATPEYNAMSDKEKRSLISGAKDKIKNNVMKEYGFEYKAPPKDKGSLEHKKALLQTVN